MQSLIDELYESWVNGNRTYVVSELISWRGARAVLAGALLSNVMSQDDRVIFNRMLMDRINECY